MIMIRLDVSLDYHIKQAVGMYIISSSMSFIVNEDRLDRSFLSTKGISGNKEKKSSTPRLGPKSKVQM
jgi:hypothetical protein